MCRYQEYTEEFRDIAKGKSKESLPTGPITLLNQRPVSEDVRDTCVLATTRASWCDDITYVARSPSQLIAAMSFSHCGRMQLQYVTYCQYAAYCHCSAYEPASYNLNQPCHFYNAFPKGCRCDVAIRCQCGAYCHVLLVACPLQDVIIR